MVTHTHRVARHTALSPSSTSDVTTPEADVMILRAARDDPSAFAPIYDVYFDRIYAYCLRCVGTPQEAEDLTSVIFIRALKGAAGYRGGSVAAWLFRIAHNVVANHHRDKPLTVPLDDELEMELPQLQEAVIHAEACGVVRALVQALPDDDRELIALRITAELSATEIGELLGKRAGTVRMRLHRLFKRLRDALGEDVS